MIIAHKLTCFFKIAADHTMRNRCEIDRRDDQRINLTASLCSGAKKFTIVKDRTSFS